MVVYIDDFGNVYWCVSLSISLSPTVGLTISLATRFLDIIKRQQIDKQIDNRVPVNDGTGR